MGITLEELIAALKEANTDPETRNQIVTTIVERYSLLGVSMSLQHLQGDQSDNCETVCLDDVQAERLDWLWLGYIPFGMVTLVAGDPGTGKGTLMIDLAARLSRGCPMPNSELERGPMTTLLMSAAEDDLARTIKPRLQAARADCRFVYAVKGLPTLPDDLPLLQEQIERLQARLVVIDPLNAYLNGRVDGHKDQDIRRALSPLKRLAETTGAAIVLVHHLNKAVGGPAMYRTGGSIAIPGVARSALMVSVHPQEADQRVCCVYKGNLAVEPPTLAFSLIGDEEHEVARVEWHGPCELTADDLVSRPGRNEDGSKLEQAQGMLRRLLADGSEHLSEEVDQALQAEGIGHRTIKRARQALGVTARKNGGKWYISLPTSDDMATKSAKSSPLGTLAPLPSCLLESVDMEEWEEFSPL